MKQPILMTVCENNYDHYLKLNVGKVIIEQILCVLSV